MGRSTRAHTRKNIPSEFGLMIPVVHTVREDPSRCLDTSSAARTKISRRHVARIHKSRFDRIIGKEKRSSSTMRPVGYQDLYYAVVCPHPCISPCNRRSLVSRSQQATPSNDRTFHLCEPAIRTESPRSTS